MSCEKMTCGHPKCCLSGIPDFIGNHDVCTIHCDMCEEVAHAKIVATREILAAVELYSKEKDISIQDSYIALKDKMLEEESKGGYAYFVISRLLKKC